jgi:hypothetical protein
MLKFKDLQDEVKRRALRNQAGTEYDIEIKNVINSSLFRISREANWRVLRRKTYFTVKANYTSGTNFVSVTQSSTAVSLTSTACNLWTDQIEIGRRVRLGGSGWYYQIRAINSNTNFVLDLPYRGDTVTNTSYEVYPQEEYTLPIQVDHRAFLWHEDFGYPYRMTYIPDQTFFDTGVDITNKSTPTHYRMWGENNILSQVPTATPITLVSSSNSDITTKVIVFGVVGGFQDYEEVTLIGTSSVNTGKEFDSVERVSKDSSTYGKITITSSRGSYTVAIIPAGNTSSTIKYSKVQLYPLPIRLFDINVYYYKCPDSLVNDDDIHELGKEFDESIILLSVAKIKYQESQAEGDRWIDMYVDEIRNLRKFNIDKIDWLPTLQRPYPNKDGGYIHKYLKRSQAGSYF